MLHKGVFLLISKVFLAGCYPKQLTPGMERNRIVLINRWVFNQKANLMMDTLPMIEAQGSHHEVGQQIGLGCRAQIRNVFTNLRAVLPGGVTWPAMLEASKRYLEFSREV